jgi:hypothetical protein
LVPPSIFSFHFTTINFRRGVVVSVYTHSSSSGSLYRAQSSNGGTDKWISKVGMGNLY